MEGWATRDTDRETDTHAHAHHLLIPIHIHPPTHPRQQQQHEVTGTASTKQQETTTAAATYASHQQDPGTPEPLSAGVERATHPRPSLLSASLSAPSQCRLVTQHQHTHTHTHAHTHTQTEHLRGGSTPDHCPFVHSHSHAHPCTPTHCVSNPPFSTFTADSHILHYLSVHTVSYVQYI